MAYASRMTQAQPTQPAQPTDPPARDLDATESPAPHMTPDEFRTRGHEIVEWIAHYYERLDGAADEAAPPVMARVQPGEVYRSLPGRAPEEGESWSAIIRDLDELIMPGVTHWQSPSFYGFFPAAASEPALLGDMISSAFGVQGFQWHTCPALTELEMRVTDWLAQLIDLPSGFTIDGSDGRGGGVIQCTASDSSLVAMLAARERKRRATEPTPHPSPLPHGERGQLIAYASSQSHVSIVKAAMVIGIGREQVRLIDVDESLAMRSDALARAIAQDRAAGHVPFFVCSTTGTTSTCAFDPLDEVGEVARREGLWHHVDAAYAGAALVCPEFRWIAKGVELADSFNFNPHKWLLTTFDCSVLWTQDRNSIIQALSITPEYLRNAASESGEVIDYRDWQVPLGRRFRALKLWFVLRHYGARGLQAHIRDQVRIAGIFEELARADERFDVPTKRDLGLVCFRLQGDDERTRELHQRLNASGDLMLTHSVVPVGPDGQDRYVLRFAVGAPRTRETHVRAAWARIVEEATGVLS